MSTSRREKTILSVVKDLNDKKEEIPTDTYGSGKFKRTVWMVGDSASLTQPPNQAQRLKNMCDELSLKMTDFINTPGEIHKKRGKINKKPDRTLLVQAIYDDDFPLFKTLLDHGADPGILDENNENAFMHAARLGKISFLKELMKLVRTDAQENEPNKKLMALTDSKSEGPSDKAKSKQSSSVEIASSAEKTLSSKANGSHNNSPSALRIEVKLDLEQVNILKDLVQKFILNHPERKHEEKAKGKENKAKGLDPEKQDKKNSYRDTINALNTLIKEAHDLNAKSAEKAPVVKKESLTEKPVTKTGILVEADLPSAKRVYQEKWERARHSYYGFFQRKWGIFKAEEREKARKDKEGYKAAQKRKSLRKEHGLILLTVDHELPCQKTLEEVSQKYNYEPILIKSLIKRGSKEEQFSLFGRGYDPDTTWSLEKFDADKNVDFKTNQALMDRFNSLEEKNEPVLLESNDGLLTSKSERNVHLMDLIHRFHVPLLNDEKKIDFEFEKEKDSFVLHEIDFELEEEKDDPVLEKIVFEFEEEKDSPVLDEKEEGHHQKSLLPLSWEDQAKVRAALNLIKDYYAPESAPLPHFLECGALRRLMTFHLGRRYCERAKTLYEELSSQPLTHTVDLRKIHERLSTERDEINSLRHDENNKNSEINSSFSRRLSYTLERLEKTKAYLHATECSLQLMSDKPTDDQIKRNDLYLYQENDRIYYGTKTSAGTVKEQEIQKSEFTHFDALLATLKKLNPGNEQVGSQIKSELLKITSKRGHTRATSMQDDRTYIDDYDIHYELSIKKIRA